MNGWMLIQTGSQCAGQKMTRTLITDLGFVARHDVIEGYRGIFEGMRVGKGEGISRME